MMHRTPKISVGMPVFNGEPYLPAAIESILNQTDGDFELVICDNASTDATGEICRSYAAQDGRIRYFRNPTNLGAARNYNLVFAHARAPYFRWANADDLSAPELHARCLSVLENHTDVVLAYGKTRIIDRCGRLIELYDDKLDLRADSPAERFRDYFRNIGLSNVLYGLMRRPVLARTALMGDGRVPAADLILIAELTLHGKFHEIPSPLFSRRMHSDSSSWDRANQSIQQQFWGAPGNRWVLPTWRTSLRHFRSVLRAPLSLEQKAQLSLYLLRRMVWFRQQHARDLYQLAGSIWNGHGRL